MSVWGEISAPGSRATWDDEDAELDFTELRLTWDRQAPPKENIKTFMIIEGKDIRYNEGTLIDSISEINLKLCEGKNGTVICYINNYDIMKSSEIIELLQHYLINSECVTAVVSKPLSEYRTHTLVDSSCIIRSLYTTSMKPVLNIPRLEQPNIIGGVSAGAISLREHLDKPAVMYVCYIEYPENYDVDEIKALLKKLNIELSTKNTSAITNSNMYI